MRSAGVGLYRYAIATSIVDPQFQDELIALGLDASPIDVRRNKFGDFVGGGVEHSVSMQWMVIAEGRYHAVGTVVAIERFNGSGFDFSVGLKRYV